MSRYEITVKKEKRRTVTIAVLSSGKVVVKAPNSMSDSEINEIIEKRNDWIISKIELAKRQEEKAGEINVISDSERDTLVEKAKKVIPEKCRLYAAKVGVDYGRITLRWQRTRFGSCSSLGNLNFNIALMLAPEDVLDYVVVHELCHRKEMNHSQRFYAEVRKVLPDYKKSEKWLKENGRFLMKRAGIV